jgi:hypothetical protein
MGDFELSELKPEEEVEEGGFFITTPEGKRFKLKPKQRKEVETLFIEDLFDGYKIALESPTEDMLTLINSALTIRENFFKGKDFRRSYIG